VLTTEKGPDSSGRAARMRLRAKCLVAGEVRNSRQKDARAPPIATARPPTKAALTSTTVSLWRAQVVGCMVHAAVAKRSSRSATTEDPAAGLSDCLTERTTQRQGGGAKLEGLGRLNKTARLHNRSTHTLVCSGSCRVDANAAATVCRQSHAAVCCETDDSSPPER